MAHILRSLNVLVVVDELDRRLASVCHRFPLVDLGVLIPDEPKYFLLICFLESPALRQESLVENVSVIGSESHSLHYLA